MGFSPSVFTMWRKLLFLSFKNVFSLSLSWNPVWVPTCLRERSSLIIFIHFHIYINTLTLSTSNYQFNWSYLLGLNQEESVYKNKEHLNLYSYNVEKQLNRAYHAFFKKAQERLLSHCQEYCSSSEQISFSWSPSPLIFHLKDVMNNLAGQALSLYHVPRVQGWIVACFKQVQRILQHNCFLN